MIFGTLINVLDQDNKPVRKLSLFEYFQTKEAAEAAGFKVEFDENKPFKAWVAVGQFTPDEDDMVAFSGVALAKDRKTPLVDAKGKPFGKKFKVPAEDLFKLNIPQKHTVGSDVIDKPAPLGEYQLPLSELQDGEFWDFVGFGLPCVRKITKKDIGVPQVNSQTSGDLAEILAKLDEISAKLDLIGASVFKN
jgi:hypothetical protein